MPELSSPVTRVHASYLAAIDEYQAEGGYPDFDRLDVRAPAHFAAYVARLRRDPRAHADPGMAKMTLLWWIDGHEYLGRISIWHSLAGDLADSGHIGYDIRPCARGRGHATGLFAAALPQAARLGIDPALVTVRAGNHASRRVVEANGGRLVKQRDGRLYFHVPCRYP